MPKYPYRLIFIPSFIFSILLISFLFSFSDYGFLLWVRVLEVVWYGFWIGLIITEFYININILITYFINKKKISGTPIYPIALSPFGLKPYYVGTIINGEFHFEDYFSLIIDLVENKYIKFKENSEGYCLEDMNRNVKSDSENFLDKVYLDLKFLVFDKFNIFNLNSITKYYGSVQGMYFEQIYEQLIKEGIYSFNRVTNKETRILILATYIFVLPVLLVSSISWIVIILIIFSIIIYFLANNRRVYTYAMLTEKGINVYIQLLGYRMFLERVFKNEKKFETLENYESHYPFLLAYKIDTKYSKIMEKIFIN